MTINWFPGHMHKAKTDIARLMPKIDVIIEVLDARLPFSSENPLVPKLKRDKPVIKILNKSDLADPKLTQYWLDYYAQQQDTQAIALNHLEAQKIQSLLQQCHDMMAHRNLQRKLLNVLILGIPNVGKSTLINKLAGRVITKTGNEPAVTKAQQQIQLPNHILLHDTPGFLWPKLEPEDCGYRLAISGAIKAAVIDYEDIAFYLANYLLAGYPNLLKEYFKLDSLPDSTIELMDAIGLSRGALSKGGLANLHKVSEILINEFRSGQLGRVSLETPEMIIREQIHY